MGLTRKRLKNFKKSLKRVKYLIRKLKKSLKKNHLQNKTKTKTKRTIKGGAAAPMDTGSEISAATAAAQAAGVLDNSPLNLIGYQNMMYLKGQDDPKFEVNNQLKEDHLQTALFDFGNIQNEDKNTTYLKKDEFILECESFDKIEGQLTPGTVGPITAYFLKFYEENNNDINLNDITHFFAEKILARILRIKNANPENIQLLVDRFMKHFDVFDIIAGKSSAGKQTGIVLGLTERLTGPDKKPIGFRTMVAATPLERQDAAQCKVVGLTDHKNPAWANYMLQLNSNTWMKDPNCYICGLPLNPYGKKGEAYCKMFPMECEHILPFLVGKMFFGLISIRNATDIQKKILQSEYLWSHKCCNQKKSNICPLSPRYASGKYEFRMDEKNIELIINLINETADSFKKGTSTGGPIFEDCFILKEHNKKKNITADHFKATVNLQDLANTINTQVLGRLTPGMNKKISTEDTKNIQKALINMRSFCVLLDSLNTSGSLAKWIEKNNPELILKFTELGDKITQLKNLQLDALKQIWDKNKGAIIDQHFLLEGKRIPRSTSSIYRGVEESEKEKFYLESTFNPDNFIMENFKTGEGSNERLKGAELYYENLKKEVRIIIGTYSSEFPDILTPLQSFLSPNGGAHLRQEGYKSGTASGTAGKRRSNRKEKFLKRENKGSHRDLTGITDPLFKNIVCKLTDIQIKVFIINLRQTYLYRNISSYMTSREVPVSSTNPMANVATVAVAAAAAAPPPTASKYDYASAAAPTPAATDVAPAAAYYKRITGPSGGQALAGSPFAFIPAPSPYPPLPLDTTPDI